MMIILDQEPYLHRFSLSIIKKVKKVKAKAKVVYQEVSSDDDEEEEEPKPKKVKQLVKRIEEKVEVHRPIMPKQQIIFY